MNPASIAEVDGDGVDVVAGGDVVGIVVVGIVVVDIVVVAIVVVDVEASVVAEASSRQPAVVSASAATTSPARNERSETDRAPGWVQGIEMCEENVMLRW